MHVLDPLCQSIKREFEDARSESAQAARSQTTHELNQLLRRLRQYESEAEWISAVLDAALRFVHQVSLFTLREGVLSLRGQHNLNLASDLSFPSSAAAAFHTVINSKDRVIALRTLREVGEALSTSRPEDRAHLIPITNRDRVVAVLFVPVVPAKQPFDLNGLELVAGFASVVLERASDPSQRTQIALQPASQKSTLNSSNSALPSWADLPEHQQTLHLRAQRFARVKVAEMQVSRPDACQEGRQQANFYVFLKREIDAARDTYLTQFMSVPSMIDYLHLELVRTAVQGDERKLGADYPGQLD